MSILDPQIPRNRREFDRWRRRQLIGIPITAVLGMVWVMTFVRYTDFANDALAWASVVPLALYGVFVLYTEYRRFMIYRRDLRERRDLTGSTG